MKQNNLQTFAKSLAHEIIGKQHKVLDGQWPGLDMSVVIEVRLKEFLATNPDPINPLK